MNSVVVKLFFNLIGSFTVLIVSDSYLKRAWVSSVTTTAQKQSTFKELTQQFTSPEVVIVQNERTPEEEQTIQEEKNRVEEKERKKRERQRQLADIFDYLDDASDLEKYGFKKSNRVDGKAYIRRRRFSTYPNTQFPLR